MRLLFFFLLAAASLSAQKRVVTTTSILGDMVEVISGGLVETHTLVPNGEDPRSFEPGPADSALVASSDLFIVNGLGLESEWINRVVAPQVPTVVASAGIPSDQPPQAWMNVKSGQQYITNIRDALIAADPEHDEQYRFNAGLYLQQLADVASEKIKLPGEVEPALSYAYTLGEAGTDTATYLGLLRYATRPTPEVKKVREMPLTGFWPLGITLFLTVIIVFVIVKFYLPEK